MLLLVNIDNGECTDSMQMSPGRMVNAVGTMNDQVRVTRPTDKDGAPQASGAPTGGFQMRILGQNELRSVAGGCTCETIEFEGQIIEICTDTGKSKGNNGFGNGGGDGVPGRSGFQDVTR